MKVSVILPVFNNRKYLAESIESILNQTHKDFELMICDDKSTEPVWDIINSYKDKRIVKFHNIENMGVPFTVNRMMDESTGDCFTQQASDDISDITRLGKGVALFNKGYDFVMCRAKKINEQGQEIKNPWMEDINQYDANHIRKNIGIKNFICGGAAMWSRKVFETIGYFDPKMIIAQDYNYWIRTLARFKVGIVNERLYTHRDHPKSHRTIRGKSLGINFAVLAQERAISHPIILEGKNN